MNNNSRRSWRAFGWRSFRLGATLLCTLIPMTWSQPAPAQDTRAQDTRAQDTRKVKVSVQPEYPELARRNNIRGVARVQLVIAPDGNVKEVRVLGGNPVLAQAAVEAVKKWKYETASAETTVILKFEFTP